MIKQGLFLLAFCLIINFFSLKAQETKESKISGIKLYYNGIYNYSKNDLSRYATNDSGWIYKKEKYNIGFITIGIEINRSGFFKHEIEIIPIRISSNEGRIEYFNNQNPDDTLTGIADRGKMKKIDVALRYQLNHYFKLGNSFFPYFSLGAQIHYDHSKYKPFNSFFSGITEDNIGLLFSIIPGISIKASKKLAIDFNVPIAFNDFRLRMTNFKNPFLTDDESKKSKFISEYMPEFINIRVGIVYSL